MRSNVIRAQRGSMGPYKAVDSSTSHTLPQSEVTTGPMRWRCRGYVASYATARQAFDKEKLSFWSAAGVNLLISPQIGGTHLPAPLSHPLNHTASLQPSSHVSHPDAKMYFEAIWILEKPPVQACVSLL